LNALVEPIETPVDGEEKHIPVVGDKNKVGRKKTHIETAVTVVLGECTARKSDTP
jgi:hypothetical protein